VNDSIEYQILNRQPREVWHCSVCKRYRHRDAVKGLLPAICCGQPAKLIDRYSQPIPVTVSERLLAQSAGSWSAPSGRCSNI
jgi:hypothetical protein